MMKLKMLLQDLGLVKIKDEHLPTFDDVVKIANEYNMNLNVELKGITGPNGLALSKSMVSKWKNN